MALIQSVLGKFHSDNKTASQRDKILKHIDNIQAIFEQENLFEYCKKTLSIIKEKVENNEFHQNSENNDLFTIASQLARALDGYWIYSR